MPPQIGSGVFYQASQAERDAAAFYQTWAFDAVSRYLARSDAIRQQQIQLAQQQLEQARARAEGRVPEAAGIPAVEGAGGGEETAEGQEKEERGKGKGETCNVFVCAHCLIALRLHAAKAARQQLQQQQQQQSAAIAEAQRQARLQQQQQQQQIYQQQLFQQQQYQQIQQQQYEQLQQQQQQYLQQQQQQYAAAGLQVPYGTPTASRLLSYGSPAARTIPSQAAYYSTFFTGPQTPTTLVVPPQQATPLQMQQPFLFSQAR